MSPQDRRRAERGRPVSLVIDISVSRVDYLLTVQARRIEDRTPGRDVYTYQVSISGPIAGTRIAAPPKPIGFVEHAYSHGALDLTRKALDLAQAWIDKEGSDGPMTTADWIKRRRELLDDAHVLYKAAEGVESLTEQALREARETRVPEPLPVVTHKGPHDTDAAMFARVVDNLVRGYAVGGSNVRDAPARLIRREIARAEGTTP